MQFAQYQEKLFKDLLSYRYVSVGMGGRMEFPKISILVFLLIIVFYIVLMRAKKCLMLFRHL